MDRRQEIVDWLRAHGNPRAESLLNSLNQMNLDEWEQKNRKDLRKLEGYADLEKSTVPLRDRARGEFDNYVDNPEWYIKGKAAKLGVNIEDLKKTLNELEEERKWEEGRAHRKEETEKNFKWNFLPESSRQRYINTPESSLFGVESPELSLSNVGQGKDIRDAALGGIAAGLDFLPGIGGVFVGPAIRAGRNYLNDMKSEDITTNVMADIGLNAGVEYLPTLVLNRGRKVASKIANKASQYMNAKEAYKTALDSQNKTMKYINKSYDDTDGLNAVKFKEFLNDLPDGPFKSEMLSTLDSKGINAAVTKAIEPKMIEQGNLGFGLYNNAGAKSDEAADVAFNWYNAQRLPKSAKVVGEVLSKTKEVGPGLVKGSFTYNDKRNPVKDDTSKRAEIDWYKANYARDWDMGFEPKGKESDPIVKAYKEYIAEKEMNRQTPRIEDIF